MPKNKLSDLRNHLFEAIERLAENQSPLQAQTEIERAKAISEVAQTIINSAKVELQFLELTGEEVKSEFLQPSDGKPALPQAVPARKTLSTGKNFGENIA